MGFQQCGVSLAHAVCHSRLSKMEQESGFQAEQEHLGSSQSSPVAGPFAPTPSLHLLIQSSTVQPCGDETPEPESSSLGINRGPGCTSPDISALSHLAPCRHTQPSTGLERAEVENCLIKSPPYQVPTIYNTRCPTNCPLVTGDL